MRTLIFAALSSVAMLACADKKQAEVTLDKPKPDRKEQPAVASNEECFRWVSGKDTVDLRLVRTADNIRGRLRYMWYEKDKSNGTIVGVFKRDTLKADYRFESEGMESFREVVFIRKDNQLIQGNGDMADRKGKMVFTGKLSFENSISMTKAECR